MPISSEDLCRRLKTAREAAGLTQADAAKHVNLPRPAIVEIEAGRRRVTGLELARFGTLYGRELAELLAPDFANEDELHALFRAQPDFQLDTDLRGKLMDWRRRVRSLTNLEALLDAPRRACTARSYRGSPLSTRWNAIQQGERLAEDERGRLGLGRAPVPDLPTLLESQGIRTAVAPLRDDISGLTLQDGNGDILIMVNGNHAPARHRFSFAHEYAHVLIDRDRGSIVSRAEDRDELIEMRANSFAAGFLMPLEGVLEFVRDLGKGQGSRESAVVFDDSADEPLRVEGRAAPGSQDLQMYDAIQAAAYFGVSRIAMIYRFKTLGLIKQRQLEELRAAEEARWADELAKLVGDGVADPPPSTPSAFQRRFAATALEAFRRELISRGKLREMAELIELDAEQQERLLNAAAEVDHDPGAGA